MKITGLVLTIGEPTTQRALDALQDQTLPVDDIVVVRDVTPFHRAINEGISRIKTPFFLQCDADMVPDPDCVETLAGYVEEDTGVVIAHLLDELWGKIQAIKLFRTDCARDIGFSDRVSPDTHYISRLASAGFKYVFARRSKSRYDHPDDVLGKHLPDYSLLYTFNKFRLEGARMRERGNFGELVANLERLGQSTHPMAKIAMIGICRGVFDDRDGDGLSPYESDADFRKLQDYIDNKVSVDRIFDPISVD